MCFCDARTCSLIAMATDVKRLKRSSICPLRGRFKTCRCCFFNLCLLPSKNPQMRIAPNNQASDVPLGSRFSTKTCLLNAIKDYRYPRQPLFCRYQTSYSTTRRSHCIQAVKARYGHYGQSASLSVCRSSLSPRRRLETC